MSRKGMNLRYHINFRETGVQSLGREDILEKEMATHSSVLAWSIPWMEEPGRLQSMGSQRVGHDWATSFPFQLPNFRVLEIMCRTKSLFLLIKRLWLGVCVPTCKMDEDAPFQTSPQPVMLIDMSILLFLFPSLFHRGQVLAISLIKSSSVSKRWWAIILFYSNSTTGMDCSSYHRLLHKVF